MMNAGWFILPLLAIGVESATLVADPGAQTFTSEQAARGKQLYREQCAQCHGANLEGSGAPALTGLDFRSRWKTVDGVLDYVATAMPPVAPGQLKREDYVEILAHMMQVNGVPSSATAMPDRPENWRRVAWPQGPAQPKPGQPETAEGAQSGEAGSDVPQAFTWGKKLPVYPAADASLEEPGVIKR